MVNEDIVPMSKELSEILGSIIGAKRVEEQLCLQYIVVLGGEEHKTGAEQVAQTLMEQANEKGVALEITVATEQEMKEAHDRLQAMMNEGN